MAYQNKKVTLSIDEATMLKLQSIAGNVSIKDRDYQQLLQKCINKIYEITKGKKL